MASDLAVRTFYEKVCTEALPKAPLFAVSLDKYMELQKKTLPFMNEPWIVRKCCDFLRDHGLKAEGIFRVPGSASTIKKISENFDAGQNPDFGTSGAFVEDVAGILKKYLRDLPEPLISDGSPEDPLQKAFLQVTIEMEDEDDLGPHLATLNMLLKQLPKYRKAVVCDLYHLFSCIVAYQSVNLMSSDNVATIFGGMTDIMTSLMTGTQRSRLVRIMIDNFVTVFEGVNELETRADEPVAKDTKEGIRVYLHDGTFKSLFCQSSEPSKDIRKKVIAKIQQTSEIVENDYHLYEIRDAMWRRVAENERVLPILKSGSALLITDRLKGERSEKPKPPQVDGSIQAAPVKESGSRTPRGGAGSGDNVEHIVAPSTSKLMKSGKTKRDKSPRSSESTTPPNSATASPAPLLSVANVGGSLSGSLARPSPRETNLPPIAFNSPQRMLLWVFPHIPAGSMKATEWDPDSTVEGHVDLKCSPTGSSVHVVAGTFQQRFSPTHMTVVDDSTRYFVMSTHPARRIGLGFETREEAAKFKNLLQHMMQYDQIHAIDADPVTQLTSVAHFATGPIGFHQRLEDGFYDTGNLPCAGSTPLVPSLRDLATATLDLKLPEVILVNKEQDVRLERFTTAAAKLVPPHATIEERAKVLALFVSNVFGGTDISDGVGSLDDHDSPYASLEGISRDSINSLRVRTKSNVVKLGNVTHGVRRHRAILFKYIADRLEPILPSSLARTVPAAVTKLPSYSIVVPYPTSASAFAYVDLVNEPGFSYPFDSPVTESFASHLHGTLPALPAEFQRHLELVHPELNNVWYLAASITHPPTVGTESITRVFEALGASAHSKVYRGVLGAVPVTIKEVVVDHTTGTSTDELTKLAALQTEHGTHSHLVHTFGFAIENGTARFFREYLGLGSLEDQIRVARTKSQPFDEAMIWSIVHEMVAGLKHIHAKELVHGNLSTSNVLLDGDETIQNFSVIKLADPLYTTSRSILSAKHDNYRAPETINDPTPSKAADIWSIGAIIAEMAAERQFTAEALQNALTDPECEFGSFANIIQECCNTDPSKRPNITQVEEKAQAALFPLPVSPH